MSAKPGEVHSCLKQFCLASPPPYRVITVSNGSESPSQNLDLYLTITALLMKDNLSVVIEKPKIFFKIFFIHS